MTESFKADEIREPAAYRRGVLSFEDRSDGFLVARDEEGRLYHKPVCPDFAREGRCVHIANAEARAETPRPAFAHDAASMALIGVEEGRALRAIAADIVGLAFVQEDRERYLAEWRVRQNRGDGEKAAQARAALQRYADPCR